MFDLEVSLTAIFVISVVALLSPGPAMLVVMGAAMAQGQARALCVAMGIITISLFWSAAAAFGLAAIMQRNAWVFETVRYAGGIYLLFLAYKAAQSAYQKKNLQPAAETPTSLRAAYLRGATVHLANPKPILFFGSLFSLAVPQGAPTSTLLVVMMTVAVPTVVIFCGFAVVFSLPAAAAFYRKAHRWIEAIFAFAFGIAGLRILISRS